MKNQYLTNYRKFLANSPSWKEMKNIFNNCKRALSPMDHNCKT